MKKVLNLSGFSIGAGYPVFIMAEAGVNHNGDRNLARDLIREAKHAGADCVKFQTFEASRVITRNAPKAEYQLKTTDPNESQFEMLRQLELTLDDYKGLIVQCKQEDIIFISTPYSPEDVDFLDDLGVPAFKMASIHIVEPHFLQYVARKGKPMFVSTGMATLAEVDEAVRAIRETGNDQIVVLQCTTNYPSRIEDANLRAMQTMRDAFDVLCGYSDHTQSDTACIASIGLGACVIEKHFTLDKSMTGPDHSSSFNPFEFEQMVKRIREAELSLGSSLKAPAAVEQRNALGMRRSIVAKRKIFSGEVITDDMLTFKRPANGLRPSLLSEILGRSARVDIEADEFLTWEILQ